MNPIGQNLRKIRLLKNLSLQKAGELLNMSATAVAKYEKGDLLPDSQKLIEFSDAYNCSPLDFIKKYKSPKMKFTSFRKKKRLTGQKLELLKELIEEEVAKNLSVLEMSEVSIKKVKLQKYKCSSLEEAELIGEEFRNFIKISNIQPISDLTNNLENLGIVIIEMKNFDTQFEGFDGLSEIVNGIPFIVLPDNIKDGARQRFTIAHELGHLVLNITNEELDEEILCNRFASAVLMPKKAVINEFGPIRKNINLYELAAFKNEYKVSFQAIAHRLKDLNIISEYLYKKLIIILNQKIGKNDPDPIIPEKSCQFKKIVYKLEADEIISLNKACELLGINENEYNRGNYYY